MPGLFGVIAKTGTLTPRDLQTMARRMADANAACPGCGPSCGQGSFFGGRVDSGELSPENQPLATADGGRHTWLDGECRLPQQIVSPS